MNRKILLALLSILCMVVAGYCLFSFRHKSEITSNSIIEASGGKSSLPDSTQKTNDSIQPSISAVDNKQEKSRIVEWPAYTNKKLGLSFQHPPSWIMQDKETEVINRAGNVTETDVNFADSLSGSTFQLSFHQAPAGESLYKYATEQFETKQGWYATGAKKIKTGGIEALYAISELTMNGKGRKLDSPLKMIVVDLPGKIKGSEVQLQFKSPSPGDKEIADFERLLSTFKFIDR